MKKIIVLILAVVLVGIGWYVVSSHVSQIAPVVHDYKNIQYTIGGSKVQLVNGVSEVSAAPGSASKIVTRYFGNEIHKDLNGDGKDDVVFLLTQETGGSGTFFYVVAALATDQGYVGSQGMLIGDRIAPQTTESGDGATVIVNYADRAPGEPFTKQPSVGKSLRLLLDPKSMQFGEVVNNFEGEADPSRMKLTMKPWNWISTRVAGTPDVTPKQPGKFTVTFSSAHAFSATTDCNSMSGTYTAEAEHISFGPIASTQMYCEGSQERDFANVLEGATKYHFTSRGELIVDLKAGGTATFK